MKKYLILSLIPIIGWYFLYKHCRLNQKIPVGWYPEIGGMGDAIVICGVLLWIWNA